jgi:hypothetical protein
VTHRTTLHRSLLALSLAGATSLPAVASAFCRQTTCEADDCLYDTSGCVIDGDPLYYDTQCLSFAVDEGSGELLGIDDDALVDIVQQAFDNWKSVTCPGGGSPNFEVSTVGAIPAGGIFFCEEEQLNVSVWTLDETWNYDATSLGYTTSTFVVGTGEVYDADVELNLRRIANILRSDQTIEEALLSVATHEAGLFLGLAHSNKDNAVMAASYRDLTPRPLTSDDIAGICELYPPGGSLTCSEPGVSEAGYDESSCEDVASASDDDAAACSTTSGNHPGRASGLSVLLAFAVTFAGLRRKGGPRRTERLRRRPPR